MDIAETEKDEGAGMKEYIEREAALEILKRNPIGTWRGCPVYSEEIKSAADEIGDLPAADVAEVRHGRWIFEPGKIPYCSECKEYSDDGDKGATFCPWCGARMNKEAAHD